MPPKFLLRFFKWFCHPDLHPYIEGDLLELYLERRKIKGKRKADRKFFLEVILLFRPGIIKPLKRLKHLNHISMLKNFIKVGFRNLRKHKGYAGINIFGLAIGLAVSFITLLFIFDEISYDKFHKDGDRIYRITKRYFNGDKIVETVPFRSYLLDRMEEEIPAIESICNLKPFDDIQIIQFEDKSYQESQIAFADSNFFNFFTFPLLEGDASTTLKEPYTVSISKSKAAEYFRDKSPLGEVLSIEKSYDKTGFKAVITGVFEDMPENSHFKYDFLVSMKTGEIENERIGIYSFPLKYGYLKLNPSNTIAEVSELIPGIEEKYAPSFYADYDMHLEAQALHSIHLRSHKERELSSNGDIKQVYIFSAITLLLILIACFNYVNLSTAVAIEKTKNIGVRKIIGANRRQIIFQGLVESGLNSFLALLLAILLAQILLPYFNAFTGKELTISLGHIQFILTFLVVVSLVSILSGIYPAIVLSKKNLQEAIKTNGQSQVIRRALIILQFGISSVLIIATLVIHGQWKMLHQQEHSFKSEEIINVPVNSLKIRDSYALIKDELLRNADVNLVTGTNKNFISELKSFNGLTIPGREGYIDMYYASIDADFFDMYNKKILAGRNFIDYSTDSLGGIIINESAAKLIGKKPEEIVGMKVDAYDGYSPKVVGIVEDFQYQSLHRKIVPMYFQLFHTKEVKDHLKVISLKINTSDLSGTLASVEEIFKKFDNSVPFNYSFLDQDIELAYQKEAKFSQILMLMTIIGIFIACMGVFGITTAVTNQRQKEFGIRKVLGASIFNIVYMINKDFLRLVLFANLLGFPIAYWLMKKWLQNFAYQVEISFSLFVITIIISILIATLGSSYWSVKTAMSNPSESIKTM